MSEHKSIFRTFIDAMIDARTKQAAREVAYYRKSLHLDGDIDLSKSR